MSIQALNNWVGSEIVLTLEEENLHLTSGTDLHISHFDEAQIRLSLAQAKALIISLQDAVRQYEEDESDRRT